MVGEERCESYDQLLIFIFRRARSAGTKLFSNPSILYFFFLFLLFSFSHFFKTVYNKV